MAIVLLSVVTDTVAHTDYLPRIQPYVPGCPRPTLLEAVNHAIGELCDKALLWRETLPAFDLTVDEDTYDLSLPAGMEMVMPVHVRVDDKDIPPASEEKLDEMDYGWRVADSGTPFRYFQPRPGTIQFNRKAQETITDGVVIRAAVKPSADALVSAAQIYSHWRETVRRGALHYLQGMPGKEWSDPNQARLHGVYFNSQIQSALSQANRGNTRSPFFARMNSIGHRRRR